MSRLTSRRATLQDVATIVQITNDAFMADAFFKKPEFILRFSEEGVSNMVSNPAENGVFLLASDDGGSNIVGSIHFEPVKKCVSGDSTKFVGGFSAVSVPERHGKMGIGSFLVSSAETFLVDTVRKQLQQSVSGSDIDTTTLAADIYMEMGVVNVREDLFPWYEKQGYTVIRQEKEIDPGFDQIVKDGMDVYCVKMSKKIVV